MSSFQYTVFVSALIILCVIIFLRLRHRQPKYWHIGFGMVLGWSEDLETVVVLSRLLGSPAHSHGVCRRMILLSVEGVSLDSFEKFRSWGNNFSPKLKERVKFVFRGEGGIHHANMATTLITSDIPVYWHPDKKLESSSLVRFSRRYCNLTGEYYFSPKVTVEALKSAYF